MTAVPNLGPALQVMSEAKASYDRALEGAAEELSKELLAAFQTLPESVLAICWTQYTPYFNDGDVCEFSVYTPHVLTQKIVDEFEGDQEDLMNSHWDWMECYGDWTENIGYRTVPNPDYDPSKPETWGNQKVKSERHEDVPESEWNLSKEDYDAVRQLTTFIEEQEDLMQKAYGDGVIVTITRDKVTHDYYEHD